jgi:nicotinamide-nucleotide amidase
MAAIHRRAAILAVGDELTLGQTLDTNSRWLAERLLDAGTVVIEHVTVPDDVAAHAAALRRLGIMVDVIVSSGGLGPTADDLTRLALADAMNEPLVEDAEAIVAVRAYFARSSRPMPEANRVQALRPRSAACLPNPNGTAPGLAGAVGGCDVFCLPGPPREMMPMFEAQVRPRLRPPTDRRVATRVLHTIGLGESEIAQRLGDLMDRSRNPLVGTTASQAVVSCRVRYEGAEDPGPALHETEAAVRRRLEPYVFGVDDQTLPGVVLTLLAGKAATIATVESCTGGLLGTMLTDVAGSSACYLGGWVTYTNVMKQREVGVPPAIVRPGGPGAVSRECALAMAQGGLVRSGGDHCLAITGVAGPDGGSPDKPVGTVWIALVSRAEPADIRRFQFTGERANVRDWSAKSALAMLRMRLAGVSGAGLLRQAESSSATPAAPP